ncbi:hypothetical protein LOTGIDRAFT_172168 [Lottia gigantea]|uniref:Uncharacterized protein n=1 Tax=Lottia gigantea TaxID=225164 RepID=V4AXH5_LOTGI|nr:hypothetical protein LOTGIDRAFT_172168 [Lottia gigantea]ESP02288.1 hypothetical protein LOTGIDRAFT_172168 [Lottia gigantea]
MGVPKNNEKEKTMEMWYICRFLSPKNSNLGVNDSQMERGEEICVERPIAAERNEEICVERQIVEEMEEKNEDRDEEVKDADENMNHAEKIDIRDIAGHVSLFL